MDRAACLAAQPSTHGRRRLPAAGSGGRNDPEEDETSWNSRAGEANEERRLLLMGAPERFQPSKRREDGEVRANGEAFRKDRGASLELGRLSVGSGRVRSGLLGCKRINPRAEALEAFEGDGNPV
jgi:hypothetical protein